VALTAVLLLSMAVTAAGRTREPGKVETPETPFVDPVPSWPWVSSHKGGSLLHTDGSQTPRLTAAGDKIRRVVVVELSTGGVCRSDDWRGELPKHILRFIPDAKAVILFSHDIAEPWRCSECRRVGNPTRNRDHSDCDYYFRQPDDNEWMAADLVLAIGSGHTKWFDPENNRRHSFPELHKLFQSGLIGPHTLSVHVPIRKVSTLTGLFPFNFTIHDNEFVKPLSTDSFLELHHLCANEPKVKDLLYVGRYWEGKGQTRFLELVDPAMLLGYHLHFFGSAYTSSDYPQKIEALAQSRNITVTVHPSVGKRELLRHYCRSVGQVHFASGDDNPRAAYEGVYAGNVLFVTRESLLHPLMYEQEFVVPVQFHDREAFREGFGRFMELVRDRQRVEGVISSFVERHLTPETVYRRMCEDIGVCEPEAPKHPSRTWSPWAL